MTSLENLDILTVFTLMGLPFAQAAAFAASATSLDEQCQTLLLCRAQTEWSPAPAADLCVLPQKLISLY
jgi:hypothetical protein